MKRQQELSFNQYKAIDLAIYAVILLVFEAVSVFAANSWFRGRPFTVSIVTLIVALVSVRWGWYSVIHAVLGGLVYSVCFSAARADVETSVYAIYAVGNAFSALSVVFVKLVGADRIRKNFLLMLSYVVLTYASIHLGHAVVSAVLGNGFGVIVNFLATDSVSLLFSVVAVFITSKLDGVFEDQKSYLLRTQKERENSEK